MKNLIVVLSGPSGAGKGSIYNAISKVRNNVYRCVSATTRGARPGEVQDVDYDFVSVEEFLEREKNDYFFETTFFDGNYYGTPKVENQIRGEVDVFYDVNTEGAVRIKNQYPEAILIYVLPPNFERLKAQMGNRGVKRIELGKKENPIALDFDWLIINENIKESAQQVMNIMELVRKNAMRMKENQEFVKNFYP